MKICAAIKNLLQQNLRWQNIYKIVNILSTKEGYEIYKTILWYETIFVKMKISICLYMHGKILE